MKIRLSSIRLAGLAALLASTAALATPQSELLAGYTSQARAADPAFAGFSAARGERFHQALQTGGKPDTPACATCHGQDPRAAGKARTGKAIEPMALSASPGRYTDPAKVEKWFKRNCDEVLGRACTAKEKGDWLTYMFNL